MAHNAMKTTNEAGPMCILDLSYAITVPADVLVSSIARPSTSILLTLQLDRIFFQSFYCYSRFKHNFTEKEDIIHNGRQVVYFTTWMLTLKHLSFFFPKFYFIF